jgi:two-component system, chemotaxis family, CheB/CheR fusion protein
VASDKDKAAGEADPLLIVGIGASAGGVEALQKLFDSTAEDLGAAFVVVTHLTPDRQTHLHEVIARHTRMEVSLVEDGQVLRENRVYVLPSDAVITLSSHNTFALRALNRERRERNLVDVFFASLAEVATEHAVAIVLSGGGSDGTLGLKAVKEQGGLTVAQGHNHAGPGYEGMPASAIASGLVDLVVPVEHIGEKLREYVRSFRMLRSIEEQTAERDRQDTVAGALREIYAVLRKRVGHDFESYKEKTFLRRVQRRMQVLQLDSLQRYTDWLRQDAGEAGLLFRDLLIGVTSFFRDAGVFDAVATQVIPRLFADAGALDTIRVWVPGCATGEEAYSLAILMCEHMSTLEVVPKVQIFATDIDEAALSTARSGRYPAELLQDVDPDRLQRFFRAEPASYVLAKEVRELCIFSPHSVIRDPPFSRMDLVSCRNLLIYFSSELQDDVLPVFHYALKPGGFMVLGPSENISRHTDLFSPIDKKHRIFQRRVALGSAMSLPSWISRGRSPASPDTGSEPTLRRDQRLRQQIELRVMDAFAPAHIVIDADGEIVYYSNRTGKYLEPQVGSPSRQIMSMARKGLRLELRSALREAVEKRQAVVRERVEVDMDERVQFIRLTIEPLQEGEHEPLYLVVLADLGPPLTHEQALLNKPQGSDRDFAHLDGELRETRERLQSTIEEYETALEELKSGNEELVSVNEELASTNEELETSKEELQSVNEELQTVNQELASKLDELHRSNTDLRNLFDSTQIATVFLDRANTIRSYTPAVTAILNLIPSDRGRPITDIAHQLEPVDLGADIHTVLQQQGPLERAVRTRQGQVHYLMRMLPYRTVEGSIDGVIVTFVDVTPVVLAEQRQRLLVAELNHRVRNMLQVVMGMANQTLRRTQDLGEFNSAFMGRLQALGRAYELLSREGWHRVSLRDLVSSQLAGFAGDSGRLGVLGDETIISANAASSLGLILYELATNATKYGAWSNARGRVDISWQLHRTAQEDGELLLQWRESSGPPVQPPRRRGFGSELVERQFQYEFKGTVKMDFAAQGLQVTLALPAKESLVPRNEEHDPH